MHIMRHHLRTVGSARLSASRAAAPLSTLLGSLVAGALVLGCASSPSQRLQGKWVGERLENFESTEAEQAGSWVRGASFEFRGARVTVAIPTENPREGTFRVTKADKDALVVAFLKPTGEADEVALQLAANDRLRWPLGDGRAIVLRKTND